MSKLRIHLLAVLLLSLVHNVVASTAKSGNSSFQIIEGDFTWQEAKADAEARGGRLAVLNTQEKIDEVNSYLNGLGTWPYLYIGLTDEEVEGEWKWINGDPLTVSNWYPGEPSNDPDASYGEYFASSRNLGTAWNNTLNSWPEAPSSYLLELPVFQIIEGDFTWQEAKADAEARGGRLAVLNTQEKINTANNYLQSIAPWPRLYIGLTDEEVEGEWKWINGEPLTVSNWYSTEPTDGPNEDYGEFFASSQISGVHPKWNDTYNSTAEQNSYLLETSAIKLLNDDFNDGVVDAEKWDIILPLGGSAISEANGVLTTAERGTLFTKKEMPVNLEVTGSFQMNHASEHFKVVLRSDGSIVDSNTVAERKGISFAFLNDGDQIQIQRQGPDEIEILAVKSYSLTTGQSYSFRIVARGDSLSLSVNGTEELTTSSSYSAGNLVGIYSRELAGCSSDVDRLSIRSLLANADADGDGLDDSVETNTGSYVSESNIGTDPNNPDSDGDGVPDGLEISEATDPNNGDDFNPFSVNVVAYFPFNGNAIDESGSSFDLVAKNGASLATGKDGDSSGAYAFDGQDDYLEASGNFGDTTSLTISLWVNPASLNTGSQHLTILCDCTGAAGNDVRIALRPNNILSGRADKGSDFKIDRSLTSSAADPGDWTHVVYTTSEEGPSSIYFNGVYSGGSETGGRNVGYHNPLRLGVNEFGGRAFHGKIDSVRYYERVLPADEVLQLYESEASQDTVQLSNVVAIQRSGTKLVDITYDVSVSTDTPTVPISLEVSSDGGATFTVPATSLSGAIGEDVASGVGKMITWDAGADWNDQSSSTMRFKVVAAANLASDEIVKVAAGSLPESYSGGAQSVDAFYMAKTEVTWEKFQEVQTWAVRNGYDIESVGAGTGPNHPVTNVNWYQVQKWCNARSEKEGLDPVYTVDGLVYRAGEVVPTANAASNGYRLPSDKEWEFAARGGVLSNGYEYSGSNDIDAVGWYRDNSGGSSQAVATKQANELGIYDMSGNVWEWCFDSDGEGRVDRGGSFGSGPGQTRIVGDRANPSNPTTRNRAIGFRLARSSVIRSLATASDVAVSTVFVPPVLSLESFYESNGGESVTVDATPTEGFPTNFTHQWYFNGFAIPSTLGGTAGSYEIGGLPDNNGNWSVVVSNSEGSAEASFEYRVFIDSDADGLHDDDEVNIHGTNPNLSDTDGDGLSDADEINTHKTDPTVADSDSDGLSDSIEIDTHGTDPLASDSSGDGLSDGFLVSAGVNPKANYSALLSGDVMNARGYYSSSQIVDARTGSVGIAKEGNSAVLKLQIQRSDDLKTWTSDQEDMISVPIEMTGDKKFFRFAIPQE